MVVVERATVMRGSRSEVESSGDVEGRDTAACSHILIHTHTHTLSSYVSIKMKHSVDTECQNVIDSSVVSLQGASESPRGLSGGMPPPRAFERGMRCITRLLLLGLESMITCRYDPSIS